MAIGPTGTGKSSLLNALLCPKFRFEHFGDCHFRTGYGLQTVNAEIEWRKGKWLGDEGMNNITFMMHGVNANNDGELSSGESSLLQG